jgi:hypothetical protein
MFQILKERRTASFSGVAAGMAILAFIAIPVQAQERDDRQAPERDDRQSHTPEDRAFSCQSLDGQRTFCRVDMSQGPIQFARQLGDVQCVEGENWGRQDEGIWVDRGCRAEFLLPERRPDEGMSRIDPGTVLTIRTNETISANRADGRLFTGVVERDVVGDNGRVAVPRGSNVELTVRVAHDEDLILDLESVTVDGRRYAVDAGADRVDSKDGVGANERTGKFVGGGAIMGAILGAAVGGGKGAAIGAGVGAGAGAGAEIATSGREVRIPAESTVTFRIEHPLVVGTERRDAGDRDR